MAQQIKIPIVWQVTNTQALEKAKSDLQSLGGISQSVSSVLDGLASGSLKGGTDYIVKWVEYMRQLNSATMSEEQALKKAVSQLQKFNTVATGKGIDLDSSMMNRATSGYMEEYNDIVGKATKTTETFNATTGKTGSNLLSIAGNILKFQLIMGPIKALVTGFTNALKESTQVAGEAEQIFNKLDTVFQNGSKSLAEAAEMAKAYGTAVSTMAGSLSTVGDLLQAQGMGKVGSLELASEWAGKFSDIIAFKDINMTLDEFAQNFMSGAAGNLRNFRTFGSIVKESAVQARIAAEGYSDLSDEEMELQKMITRATMALEQQQNAMGATQREWDTVLSVNRRLNESWKEWKENIGGVINEALKPMKSWLDEILTVSNDIISMKSEITSGEFVIKVTPRTDQTDKAVVSLLKSLAGEGTTDNPTSGFTRLMTDIGYGILASKYGDVQASVSFASYQAGKSRITEEELKAVVLASGYSLDEVAQIAEGIGLDINDLLLDSARELIEIDTKRLNEESAHNDRMLELEEKALAYSELSDSILGARGGAKTIQEFLKGNTFGDEKSVEMVLGLNKGTISENIDEAIKIIAETIADNRTRQFNAEEEMFSLQGQYNSATARMRVSAVGSEAYNNANTEATELYNLIIRYSSSINEIKSDNEEMLKTLADLYSQESKAKASEEVQKIITGMDDLIAKQGKTKEYEALYGVGSEAASIALEKYSQTSEAEAMRATLEAAGYAAEEVNKFIGDMTAKVNEYYDPLIVAAQNAANEAQNAANGEAAGERKSFLAGLSETSYSGLYADADKFQADAIAEWQELLTKQLEDGVISQHGFNVALAESTGAINTEYENRKKLATEEFWNGKLDSLFGPYTDLAESLKTGSEAKGGSILGGIYSILIDLLSQTEFVAEVNSFTADYIVPMFDRVLEPLLPMLEAIGSMVESLAPILEPIRFILQIIASVVVLVVASIKDVIDTITVTIKWLGDWIYTAIRNIFKWKNDPLPNLVDRLSDAFQENHDEAQDTLDKIWGAVESISEEDQGYIQAIQDMNNAGILTDTEAFSLVNDKYGTSYRLNAGGSGGLGTGTVYTDNRNIVININGTDLTLDDIYKMVAKATKEGAA